MSCSTARRHSADPAGAGRAATNPRALVANRRAGVGPRVASLKTTTGCRTGAKTPHALDVTPPALRPLLSAAVVLVVPPRCRWSGGTPGETRPEVTLRELSDPDRQRVLQEVDVSPKGSQQ